MGEIILITGAAGFIGFKTVLTALEAGYHVRAVIRKPEQARTLSSHYRLAPFVDKLEFVNVPDLTANGAFDHVLSDVVAILHVASPLAIQTDDYERDVISPAIQMSTSILYSALKVPTIRRIVITSSMVTLIPMEWLIKPDDRIYTAKDFNPNPSHSASQPMEAYWNSKALARTAVRDFVKARKPHFETIQLLPGVVIGADDRALSIADLQNNTPQWSLRMSPLLGEVQEDPMVGVPVDVTDVSRAHVDAIKSSIPGNVDYTLSARVPESFEWNSMIDVARRNFPNRVGSKELPLGGTLPTVKWKVDSQQTETAFDWEFATFEDTMKAMIGQYLELIDAEGRRTA